MDAYLASPSGVDPQTTPPQHPLKDNAQRTYGDGSVMRRRRRLWCAAAAQQIRHITVVE